ncbi:MAG TPA: GspE/PulE family protein [Candidatus Paceibacterota bacterium]|nr:GspE/PulE family protein [Candidatus Paceibacterota bacterium]HPT40405.1 GspE/PulE family protein [Candidatus Paceibacterota bacterium]
MLKDDDKQKELAEKLSEFSLQAKEREAKLLAEKSGREYLNLSIINPQTQALELVSEEQAKSAFCAPFLLKDKELSLACKNSDLDATKVVIRELEQRGFKVKTYIVSDASLKVMWDSYKLVTLSKKEITGRIDINADSLAQLQTKVANLQQLKEEINKFQSPYTSQILEIILAGALAIDASDVHIEAEEKVGRLRYRIDGALQDIYDLTPTHYRSVLSRIKLLSGMKINVHSAAQDGRFTIKTKEVPIEIRVSIIPSAYGETVVMRILNPKSIQLKLEDLGFRADDLVIIDEQVKRPNGIILNTGPTGSGKTTTLYAFLRKIYDPEMKIITVEDPVEYHIEGITQTQVEIERNYTFANGLRSILRQDPDVILVGEIRDNETAEIAMNAALTGHLVFSTLHTNEAAGTIPRLLDMKIQPAILSAALNLAIAQRLSRKLCTFCRQKRRLEKIEMDNIKKMIEQIPSRVKKPEVNENTEIYDAKEGGCDKCNFTGYKGRVAIVELLLVDNNIKEMINQPQMPSMPILKEAAMKAGMVTMEQDAILKILAGTTSINEAESVLGEFI